MKEEIKGRALKALINGANLPQRHQDAVSYLVTEGACARPIEMAWKNLATGVSQRSSGFAPTVSHAR